MRQPPEAERGARVLILLRFTQVGFRLAALVLLALAVSAVARSQILVGVVALLASAVCALTSLRALKGHALLSGDKPLREPRNLPTWPSVVLILAGFGEIATYIAG